MFKLTKENRLLKSYEYASVKKKGCKFTSPHFTLLFALNEYNRTRLGLIITRKVGNAVLRNRIKRLVRECFRTNINQLHSGDYIFVAHKNNKFTAVCVSDEINHLISKVSAKNSKSLNYFTD